MTPAEEAEAEPDPEREERRRMRRRRRARLKAAALGRSRGGLTCKVHLSAERRCRPLSFVVTPGQAADSPQFAAVLAKIKVRGPVGRPRTRPGAVAGDKAYSSRANRAHLRKRKIKAVIPEKADQAANRKKKGSKGRAPGLARRRVVQGAQHRGAGHQQDQGLERAGHPLRQEAGELRSGASAARRAHLAAQSPPRHMITTPYRP